MQFKYVKPKPCFKLTQVEGQAFGQTVSSMIKAEILLKKM